jgi:hypothetical protein
VASQFAGLRPGKSSHPHGDCPFVWESTSFSKSLPSSKPQKIDHHGSGKLRAQDDRAS